MDYENKIQKIYSLRRVKDIVSLDLIKKSLIKLGNPQKNVKIIHIAGTNGKGSVAVMIAKILQLEGKKVGLFTSPHLVEFEERFKIDGHNISKENVVQLIEQVENLGTDLSFFEFITLMAFKYFENCDYAVIETGIGGRSDPTNACYPEISAITHIDFDHTHILGDTLFDIAQEKAGIIKGGCKVVVAKDIQAIHVFQRKALLKNALFREAAEYEGPIGMRGDFQKRNAGVAIAICKELGIDNKIIIQGIKEAKWPGRIDFIEKNVLVDCAHNVSGMKEFVKYLETVWDKYERKILIFGAKANKNVGEMLGLLPEMDVVIFTKPKIHGALDPNLIRSVDDDINIAVINEPADAYSYAKEIQKENDLIIICGSCYLVGNVMETLKE